MIDGLVDAYDLDHNTTPLVVRISKESSIMENSNCAVFWKRCHN